MGVDLSRTALDWAAEQAAAAGVALQLQCVSAFDIEIEAGSDDLVCDSGCFHRLAPHWPYSRRARSGRSAARKAASSRPKLKSEKSKPGPTVAPT